MKRIALLTLAVATTASAQQSIKPRPLGAIQATSKELLGLPTLARSLPNGSVIVNDIMRRRLLLLDPTLETFTVIADSTSGATNGYGQRPGGLIPYTGDSTLFLDPVAGSFVVIDPAGKAGRVMSPPRPTDNGAIAGVNNGFPGFDSNGRMIYRTNFRTMPGQTRDGSFQFPTPPDSAPLLRVDLDTRRADTVAILRTAKFNVSSITMPNGGTSMSIQQVPLATIDDWAVLSNGTIAVVRGRDYHIDFIQPDGTKRSSDKIAFDWKRLNDDDKLALIDSIQKAQTAARQAGAAGGPQMVMGGGDGMRVMMGGGGGGGRGDVMMTRESMVAMPAGAAPAAAATAAPAAAATKAGADSGKAAPAAAAAPAGPGGPAVPAAPAASIADMPDYMPAFVQTSARPDADANLWIRTTTGGSQPGNVVYDVINSQGVLVDRVDVPKGMSIVGFGKGGVVYLSQREGYGYRVLKASIK